MSDFEITKASPKPNHSGTVAAAAIRGLAFETDPTDKTKARLATAGGGFIGFSTRAVTADGPGLADHFYPGRIELPVKVGFEVGFEDAEEVEVEGASRILDTGTGFINSSTAVGTELAFTAGKFRVKQSGDTAYFKLAAQLDPETAGNVRILAQRI